MVKSRMIEKLISPVAISFLLLASCGGGGGQETGGVALFITDNISFYKQVVTTVNTVRLVNSDTQNACAVLSRPITLDITNLALDTQLVNVGECSAGQYDRIDLEFKKDVLLMDNKGDTSQCSFVSYLDENNQVSGLSCDPATGVCTLSIREVVRKGAISEGSIQVLPDQETNLTLDYDLQQFAVTDFGNTAACAVTMKVIALDAVAMNRSNRAQSATGSISQLDTEAMTFILKRGTAFSTVDYSAVLPSLQPNLDILLQTAQNEGFPVKVMSAVVDPAADVISASRVYALVEGTVFNISGNPNRTFTLISQSSRAVPVSYKQTSVDGTLDDGRWVSLKLNGYEENEYLADHAEVLPYGTVIEN